MLWQDKGGTILFCVGNKSSKKKTTNFYSVLLCFYRANFITFNVSQFSKENTILTFLNVSACNAEKS